MKDIELDGVEPQFTELEKAERKVREKEYILIARDHEIKLLNEQIDTQLKTILAIVSWLRGRGITLPKHIVERLMFE